jgi:hypothetical protein
MIIRDSENCEVCKVSNQMQSPIRHVVHDAIYKRENQYLYFWGEILTAKVDVALSAPHRTTETFDAPLNPRRNHPPRHLARRGCPRSR